MLAAGFAPSSRRQRSAVLLLITLAIAWIIVDLAESAWILAGGAYFDSAMADRVVDTLLTVCALALFVRGIARSNGIERRRLIILALAIVIGASADWYGFFGPRIYNSVEGALNLTSTALMTIGVTYAILVQRLFDIGFVINRAVVFAIISAIVVPVFILIEIFIGERAKEVGTTYGTAIGMSAAVAIGLVLRPLHRSVDRFVDQVLFAGRHRNANAIIAFADDCADVENRDRLLQRTMETLERFGRVEGCAIFLTDDHGNLREAAAWNFHADPLEHDCLVALRLRSSRRPLERGQGSPLDCADIAFPIPGRHRLAGALLCERPHRAEPYSPEEFDALEKLAQSLGTALLAIDAAEARRLRGELAQLRERARRPAHGHHR